MAFEAQRKDYGGSRRLIVNEYRVTKQKLRQQLRAARRAYVSALPDVTRALLFRRPPAPILELVPEGATIGLYRADAYEAPASGYAKFFSEQGHQVALPWFADRAAPMQFRAHTDPFGESDLETGAFDLLQPNADAEQLVPDVLFMPLVGFTAAGDRLGQGGGHYDRWLEAHPGTVRIGLAWDCQLVESLPVEPHDVPLHAVVTPTRFYGAA